MQITVTAGPNDAPTADAGANQTVSESDTVTLDGSGSSDPENEALRYNWTQTGGADVTLSNSTAEGPQFTAPEQLVSDATLTFALRVTDARGAVSAADSVQITVNAGANDAPTADAGANQTVNESDTVTLDGSGSSDPEGEALTYDWILISRRDVTLANSNNVRPQFIAPEMLINNVVLTFNLTVTDARGTPSLNFSTVSVTVTAGPNDAPTANAGTDQTVNESDTVTLDGSGMDPEGEELTYNWTQTGLTRATQVTLINSASKQPQFEAPDMIVNDTVLNFALHVTDARGAVSSPDNVAVTVLLLPDAPDTPVISGELTVYKVLTATTSPPVNGDYAIAYEWARRNNDGFTTIEGATARTYTLTKTDAGHFMRVKVYQKPISKNLPESQPAEAISIRRVLAATPPAPIISGVVAAGRRITATIPETMPPHHDVHQLWLRSRIVERKSGRSGMSVVWDIEACDAGFDFRIEARYSIDDNLGYRDTAKSISRTTVPVEIAIPSVSIAGADAEDPGFVTAAGKTLTANLARIPDCENPELGGNPYQPVYSWYRNTEENGNSGQPTGEDGKTYVTKPEDVGYRVGVGALYRYNGEDSDEIRSTPMGVRPVPADVSGSLLGGGGQAQAGDTAGLDISYTSFSTLERKISLDWRRCRDIRKVPGTMGTSGHTDCDDSGGWDAKERSSSVVVLAPNVEQIPNVPEGQDPVEAKINYTAADIGYHLGVFHRTQIEERPVLSRKIKYPFPVSRAIITDQAPPAPVISGVVEPGRVLRANSTGPHPLAHRIAYQWYRGVNESDGTGGTPQVNFEDHYSQSADADLTPTYTVSEKDVGLPLAADARYFVAMDAGPTPRFGPLSSRTLSADIVTITAPASVDITGDDGGNPGFITVGGVLRADSPAPPAGFVNRYRWYIDVEADGSGGSIIPDATGTAYTTVAAQLGRRIGLRLAYQREDLAGVPSAEVHAPVPAVTIPVEAIKIVGFLPPVHARLLTATATPAAVQNGFSVTGFEWLVAGTVTAGVVYNPPSEHASKVLQVRATLTHTQSARSIVVSKRVGAIVLTDISLRVKDGLPALLGNELELVVVGCLTGPHSSTRWKFTSSLNCQTPRNPSLNSAIPVKAGKHCALVYCGNDRIPRPQIPEITVRAAPVPVPAISIAEPVVGDDITANTTSPVPGGYRLVFEWLDSSDQPVEQQYVSSDGTVLSLASNGFAGKEYRLLAYFQHRTQTDINNRAAALAGAGTVLFDVDALRVRTEGAPPALVNKLITVAPATPRFTVSSVKWYIGNLTVTGNRYTPAGSHVGSYPVALVGLTHSVTGYNYTLTISVGVVGPPAPAAVTITPVPAVPNDQTIYIGHKFRANTSCSAPYQPRYTWWRRTMKGRYFAGQVTNRQSSAEYTSVRTHGIPALHNVQSAYWVEVVCVLPGEENFPGPSVRSSRTAIVRLLPAPKELEISAFTANRRAGDEIFAVVRNADFPPDIAVKFEWFNDDNAEVTAGLRSRGVNNPQGSSTPRLNDVLRIPYPCLRVRCGYRVRANAVIQSRNDEKIAGIRSPFIVFTVGKSTP